MKIEMCESLFYSWLRHIKNCQIVQTNWKASPKWNLQHRAELEELMQSASKLFSEKYNYPIFKKNASLDQILLQGECDVLGISVRDGKNCIYAADVAFHEEGLNYGTRRETVMKIIAKTIRTALCLWGYLDCSDAEILFASPKVTPTIIGDITPCIDDINALFAAHNLHFRVDLIANTKFNDTVVQPILSASKDIADTSELFLRSYQMLKMFK